MTLARLLQGRGVDENDVLQIRQLRNQRHEDGVDRWNRPVGLVDFETSQMMNNASSGRLEQMYQVVEVIMVLGQDRVEQDAAAALGPVATHE